MPSGGKLTVATANAAFDAPSGEGIFALGAGSYVLLSVADNGSGMDARTQERIFEPFFTTKEKGKGTGLGLSTVYGIVKQAGGGIRFASETGKGTTFSIFFPRVEGDLSGAPSASRRTGAEGKGRTVLVVEDEPGVRKLVRAQLEAAGFEVLDAGSGEEALQVSERHRNGVDLLLTDAVMPGMGVVDLMRRFRALRPGIAVLVMSGYSEEVLGTQGLRELGQGFISKPFSPGEILRKIHDVIEANSRPAAPTAG